MRIGVGIIALAAVSPAMASFEMLLASDTAGDAVRRIDPISGVTLGSFGSGFLIDPTGVSVDQTNNLAYVLDNGNRVTRWNYNTGDFAGSFSVGSGATYMTRNSDGTLNVAYASSSVLRRYSTSGTVLATYTVTTGFSVLHGFVGNDGAMYVATRTGNSPGLQQFNYNTGASVTTFGWYIDRVARFPTGNSYLNVFGDGTGAGVLIEHDQFFGVPNNTGAIASSLIASATGVAHGHDGMAYISGTNAGGTSLVLRYDSNTRVLGTPIGGLGTISSIGIVVAPEPGTMAALGLGAVALLRRRKR